MEKISRVKLIICHDFTRMKELYQIYLLICICLFFRRQIYCMISEKLSRLQEAIDSLDKNKIQLDTKIDSINLISSHLSKKTQKPSPKKSSHKKKRQSDSQMLMRNEREQRVKSFTLLQSKYIHLIYEERCKDLMIDMHEQSWEGFLKSFLQKNKTNKLIDFSGYNLKKNGLKVINQILLHRQYSGLNLSRNSININQLSNLRVCSKLSVLRLQNCNLHNDNLDILFEVLLQIPIKKLILSSPEMKDRNTLTKYAKLDKFLQNSKTLIQLQVSNIQINPENPIFQATNQRSLKRLNISKNNGICGMNRHLYQLDLSYNEISDIKPLISKDSKMQKLNLSGNPIQYYLFEQFMTCIGYPQMVHLNLSKIILNNQLPWLTQFIQKSHNLSKLQLVECQLNKLSLKSIFHGLENNKALKCLNLSKNKFPSQKQTGLAFNSALQKCHLSQLIMHQCQIKDESGATIFTNLRKCFTLKQINLSKNYLSVSTGLTFCEQLREGCYGLIKLELQQNMVKYDQLKEIVSYISRNIHMSKLQLQEQYKKLKILSNSDREIFDKTTDYHKKIQSLSAQNDIIENQYLCKIKDAQLNKIQRLKRQINLLDNGENMMKQKIQNIQKQIEQIQTLKLERSES